MIPNTKELSASALRAAFVAALFVTLAIVSAPVSGVEAEPLQHGHGGSMNEGIQIIEDFVAAFNAKDVDRIMSFFTDDAVYHNMPTGPVEGTEAVRKVIAGYVNAAASLDWEITASAQVGSTVLTERVDRFVFGGKDVVLPVMGAFDLRDGKIAAWRDYFDQATWSKQMAN